MRCVAAVVLGWVAFFGSYAGLALIATYTLRNHVVLRGETDVLAEFVMLTTVLVATLVGSFVSLRIQARPWWRAPGLVGIISAAYFLAGYASHRALVPFLWLLLSVSVFSPIVGAFLLSRWTAKSAA